MKEKDADFVCLHEVLDNPEAFHIFIDLKNQYSHFYFNIGPRSFGASSGIFVASKYKIANNDYELESYTCKDSFEKTDRYEKKTWSSDEFCAKMT